MNDKIFQSLKLPQCEVVDRETEIVNLCRGKKVLHLGCVDYPLTAKQVTKGNLLHIKIMAVAEKVLGVDTSQEGIKYLHEKYGINNIIFGDVEYFSELDIMPEFDVVVVGELIEHLANPGLFLSGLRKICTPKTLVVLTVPNAFSVKSFLRVMVGRELVHSDHVANYSFRTLSSLVQRFDFEIISVKSYLTISENNLKRLIQIFPHILIKRFTPYLADGLIVYLKRRNYHESV